MKIYRIENEETNHGMWYRLDGTFDPFILRLTDGRSKDLPMGFNDRYYQDGFRWQSGAGSIAEMQFWFSELDALELFKNDYKLFEFESNQFNVVEHEVMFTREGILTKQEIPLDTVWNMKQFH
jgi:hypothetical protein